MDEGSKIKILSVSDISFVKVTSLKNLRTGHDAAVGLVLSNLVNCFCLNLNFKNNFSWYLFTISVFMYRKNNNFFHPKRKCKNTNVAVR